MIFLPFFIFLIFWNLAYKYSSGSLIWSTQMIWRPFVCAKCNTKVIAVANTHWTPNSRHCFKYHTCIISSNPINSHNQSDTTISLINKKTERTHVTLPSHVTYKWKDPEQPVLVLKWHQSHFPEDQCMHVSCACITLFLNKKAHCLEMWY